jgi:hypothetical protein
MAMRIDQARRQRNLTEIDDIIPDVDGTFIPPTDPLNSPLVGDDRAVFNRRISKWQDASGANDPADQKCT